MQRFRKWWRWGVNRWYVLALVILGIVAARIYPPQLPHIQLPAEPLVENPLFTLPVIGPFHLTNTMTAVAIADVLLLILAFVVNRSLRKGELILTGLAGVVEAVLEALFNLTESTAGRWAKRIFPVVGTIVLLVLVVNWMELIPGVDSIGLLRHPASGQEGRPVQQIARIGGLPVVAVVKGTAEPGDPNAYTLVPYVRVASTDLNFTVGLALISVFLVQVFGIRAHGLGYFGKFLNVKSLFSRPFFGVIDFGVGLLELVSEVSKIISFSFRLFGNLFAGSVLLFVIGSLLPVLGPTLFLGLEVFVGLIQAIVFGMLTMIFIAQATAGHGQA